MKAVPFVLVAIMACSASVRAQQVEKTVSEDVSTLPVTEVIPEDSESLPLPTIKFTPPPPPKEEFEAWCGWDWNLLCPVSQFEHDNEMLPFFLSPDNVDTAVKKRGGRAFEMPAHPNVPADGFVITKGNPDNIAAQSLLTTLRDYYLKHKPRLILIPQAQEKYQADAEAWFAAHPPKPVSHTFWLKPHRGSRYLKPVSEGGDQ